MADTVIDDDPFSELVDVTVPQVDMVGAAANGTPWFFAKSEGGASLFPPDFVRELISTSESSGEAVTMTGTPAALADTMARMHEAAVRKAKYNTDDRKRMSGNGQAMDDGSYPIADEEDLDNAIHAVGRGSGGHDAIRRHIISRAKSLGASSKIPDNWGSDGSLKTGVSKADGEPDDAGALDTATVLAEPEGVGEGNPETPGSPAWEAIDAATARKWTAIAVRLRQALDVMANREMVEGAAADPGDFLAASDLEDARCAVDFVIDTLAGFAVDEQAEADLGGTLDVIGKALSEFEPDHLEIVEGFAPLLKAGRVLSAANEKALRDAATAIQQVLARLPAPESDDGEPVAKRQETAVSDTATIEAPESAPAETPTAPEPAEAVTKADGEMVAVYDSSGCLVGVVDKDAITNVVQPQAPDGGGMDEVEDAAGDNAAMIPGTHTVASPPLDDDDEMTKAAQPSELATLTEAVNALAKQVAGKDDLADVVKGLQERVEHLAKMPDDRKSPLLNGATGTAGVADRDGSTEDPYADLRKSIEQAKTPAAKREAEQQLAYARVRDRFTRPGA
ncbi:MAG TPA: hypothetical protein VIN75_18960 [Burkholderiaceae bacterium]